MLRPHQPQLPPGAAGAGEDEPSPRVLGRAEYRCVRLGRSILLEARGELMNWNDGTAFSLANKMYPPQFAFWFVQPRARLPAIRPFLHRETFGFPPEPDHVVIWDADGDRRVAIEKLSQLGALNEIAPGEELGFSPDSLEEAIEDAVARLGSSGAHAPDQLLRYLVLESGKISGGFAGLNLFFAKLRLAS